MTILQGVFESIRAKKPVVAPQAFIDDLVALQNELARCDKDYRANLAQGKLGADDHLNALNAAIHAQRDLIHLNKNEIWVLPAFFTVLQQAYMVSAIKHHGEVMQDDQGDAEARRQASAMSMVAALMNAFSDLIEQVDAKWTPGLKKPFHITDDVRSQVRSLYRAFGLNPLEHKAYAKEVIWLCMFGPTIELTVGHSQAHRMPVEAWPSPLSNATILALATTAVGVFAAGYMAVQSISSSDDMSMTP